jgi:Lrp/AsnC family transcriptional regulator, leucine-responsive regulatory protein
VTTFIREAYYDKLDVTDWAILAELQTDARLSFAELGRRIGMSSPAVQERVRKLEDYGIIEGYRAVINLPKAGLPITAFIRVGNLPGVDESRIRKLVAGMTEVLECHHITGQDCFLVKIATTSVPHLEQVLGRFSEFTHTVTAIVLSSPVQNRIITPTDELL